MPHKQWIKVRPLFALASAVQGIRGSRACLQLRVRACLFLLPRQALHSSCEAWMQCSHLVFECWRSSRGSLYGLGPMWVPSRAGVAHAVKVLCQNEALDMLGLFGAIQCPFLMTSGWLKWSHWFWMGALWLLSSGNPVILAFKQRVVCFLAALLWKAKMPRFGS